MFIPRSMASSMTARSAGESRPVAGAMPKMKKSGTRAAKAIASARSAQIGIPFGTSSSTSPESRPAFVLSMTERISYFSEYRTRPLPVLPSMRPKLPSQ